MNSTPTGRNVDKICQKPVQKCPKVSKASTGQFWTDFWFLTRHHACAPPPPPNTSTHYSSQNRASAAFENGSRGLSYHPATLAMGVTAALCFRFNLVVGFTVQRFPLKNFKLSRQWHRAFECGPWCTSTPSQTRLYSPRARAGCTITCRSAKQAPPVQ